MSKIAFVTSSPMTIKAFLLPFINELMKENEVHVIANWADDIDSSFLPKGVKLKNLSIERNPSLFSDFITLIKLTRLLQIEKYHTVHTFTPKAGLIGQLASYVSRIKNRFHTFTGQVWATQTGWKKVVLKNLDKVTAALTTAILVDSPSQQEYLIQNKVLSKRKSTVLGLGSISGVNLNKFKYSAEKRLSLRAKLGLNEQDFVFLYAGRLKVDKGIPELIAAFNSVSKNENCYLVIVGSDEDNLLPLLDKNKRVIFCGFTDDISSYFSMADLLCLPSHREGFGNVIIEAAACKLPALASNIYGLSDAIDDGTTGILHKVKDREDIELNLKKLIDNKKALAEMRTNAFIRVTNDFTEDFIVDEFMKFYKCKNK